MENRIIRRGTFFNWALASLLASLTLGQRALDSGVASVPATIFWACGAVAFALACADAFRHAWRAK